MADVRSSESIAKLATALLKAQQECDAPSKDSTNPHFRSKYADLLSVRAAMFPAFAANGLAVLQMPAWDTGAALVINRLVHTSGEWLEWTAGSPVAKADPQSWRGAVTYIRRTCLEGIGNLAAEDDDGQMASTPPKPKAQPAKGPTVDTEKRLSLTESQQNFFYKRAQGDAVMVHDAVTKVTGKPCTRNAWPPMSGSEHAKITEAIDTALDEARQT